MNKKIDDDKEAAFVVHAGDILSELIVITPKRWYFLRDTILI